MKVIYIASPYTHGDTADNVRRQIQAAHEIMDMGHAPIAPLLNHFLAIHQYRPEHEWRQADLAVMLKCDAVVRLPGFSAGATEEVKVATEHGIPVCMGMAGLRDWLNKDYMKNIQQGSE